MSHNLQYIIHKKKIVPITKNDNTKKRQKYISHRDRKNKY